MLYPIPGNEAERLAALRDLKIIGSPPDPGIDRVCALARELLDVPIVFLSLLDEHQQWFKSRCGIDAESTAREVAFCNYTIVQNDILVVEDALLDPRFANNPLVTGPPYIRFYAGTPVALHAGLPLGALCCVDTKPRQFSPLRRRRLGELAAIIREQLRLHRDTLCDVLTGLPNRKFLNEELERVIVESRQSGTKVGLLLIDVDRFKEVNDNLGHHAGDALLGTVAWRMRCAIERPSVAARIGGDEFAVLVPSVAGIEEVEAVAQSVAARLREPDQYQGAQVSCRASIGISIYPDDATDGLDLMKRADIALYAAKSAGRDRALCYEPGMQARMLERAGMLSLAREALARRWIVPFYQPKIALSTGRVTGFEALLRLCDDQGVRPPSAISDAFEDPVLSVAIGERMLDLVVADMAAWTARGVEFGSVAINVAAPEFSPALPQRILTRLAQAGLSPKRLEIEVTECVFLGDGAEIVGDVLRQLHAAGIDIALDDFGTGYASLSHLRRFPVTWLKIDRSFVSEMDIEPEAAAIVHAVISLAQSLGIGIVAEGVETEAQSQFLRRRRCDLGQGYLFGKAMPASEVRDFLNEQAVKTTQRRIPHLRQAV